MMSSSEHRRATWRQLFVDQQASGRSVTDWCALHDIALPTFYYWRKRVTDPAQSPPTPQWLALTSPVAHDPLLLHVGRVAIEVRAGFDPALLQDVLQLLETR